MKFENIIIEILILLVNDLSCIVRNKCGHVSDVNLKEIQVHFEYDLSLLLHCFDIKYVTLTSGVMTMYWTWMYGNFRVFHVI